MKKLLLCLFFTLSLSPIFSQSLQKKFIKGNITDKTIAVREASGSEAIWLTTQSIGFILSNKDYLVSDRDFDGFALATILSINNEFINSKFDNERLDLLNQLIEIFNIFSESSTVQIAVLSKVEQLNSYISTASFTSLLNKYVQETNIQNVNPETFRAIIGTLGVIGNNVSFTILYNKLNDKRYNNYRNELEKAIIDLSPIAMNEVLQIVHSKDIYQINQIFTLIQKNTKNSQKFLSEIAENVLNETILLIRNSSDKNSVVDLQIYSLRILSENKWTRASASVISFFDSAKYEYAEKILNESQFVTVINSLISIAPVDAVNPLIQYLGELNGQVERDGTVSQEVALAVINTLGAIGDKSAFDSLLSVTYLNYSEQVLSAARKALAGLKW